MAMAREDILADLTDEQRQAVTHLDGPMLVLAGAGSGKTRVVTRRIAWLISQGVWPSQILAMTFTNKAAREMRERVTALTGCEFRSIGTFHSQCAQFLRRDLDQCDYGRDGRFCIFDSSEQQSLLKDVLKSHGSGTRAELVRMAGAVISKAKNSVRDLDEVLAEDIGDAELCALLRRVAADYEAGLRRQNAFDFDDLLLYTLRMMREYPVRRELFHSRYRYLLVDEYQDTNHLQYQLLNLLTGPGANVHVTGDPDQSIYSWRGADYNNIMNFTRDYPEAVIVKLERNYRSTATILSAANALIRNNGHRIEKELFTSGPSGVKVVAAGAASELDEAEWIVEQVCRLRREGVDLRDMAVFYRTNSQSRPLEEMLIRYNVPYQLLGGVTFYQRREIRDFLAFLRLKVNARDELSLKRVADCLDFGLGPRTLQGIIEAAAAQEQPVFDYLCGDAYAATLAGKGARVQKLRAFRDWCLQLRALAADHLDDLVEAILKHSGLPEHIARGYGEENPEERLENVQSLLNRIALFIQEHPEAGLADFLAEIALVADVDAHEEGSDKVTLMTLHSSKGLEFRQVFIAGLEEGLLPHSNSSEETAGLEEERRLFYVGITRAREALYLSYCASRYRWGTRSREYSRPSQFLRELPREVLRPVRLPRY